MSFHFWATSGRRREATKVFRKKTSVDLDENSGNNSAKVLHRVVLRSGNNSCVELERIRVVLLFEKNADFSLSCSA